MGSVTETDATSAKAPLAVLMCGVAGSGKTTYAQHLETRGYVRLSVDEEIWHRFGRYGVDYEPDEYARLSEVAEALVRQRLLDVLAQRRDVVVDLSLWRRATREQYKRLVEDAGGRWKLVYMQVDPVVLRRRLDERAGRRDANAAFPVTEDVLAIYLSGFEVPHGEDEQIITVTS